MNELSEVLTVTARRLSGLTLGRKFTRKKPGTSANNAAAIAKQKQGSHCSACAEKGHWKDGDACPMKGKQSAHAKGGEQRPFPKTKSSFAPGQKHHQAFPVVHHEHGHIEIHDAEEFGNAFVCHIVATPSFYVHDVQAFSPMDFVGKMALDLACQETCCGKQWYGMHSQHIIHSFKLKCKDVSAHDVFQFGKGDLSLSFLRTSGHRPEATDFCNSSVVSKYSTCGL